MSAISLPGKVYCLDTGFQRKQMAACYAIESEGRWAIIETGTNDTVPLILAFLEQQAVSPEQVDFIIITHVHLDHAGGVGKLMESLGHAQLLVHEKGARHMIDPSKLQQGATAVYGEQEFQRTYGELLPVDERRVTVMKDNSDVILGLRRLHFIDTPGHADHHFCIFDEQTQGWFTGDTFGLAYKELDHNGKPFIIPTTTPVQFDPDKLKRSIQRLISYDPEVMYLTHFGEVHEPEKLSHQLFDQIDELVQIAQKYADLEESLQVEGIYRELMALLLRKLEHHGSGLSVEEQKKVLHSDVLLNAKGLFVYNKRQEKMLMAEN
ncbi:MBL fold metallo-hydrolase [Bermanella marisrubri]|uniref:Beta-lactamase related protein n=1 Tax=Bermanella marisrubri TaxID=207949 RepID=Q1MYS7_9GAMM|nr:MBL fold metallo-hydrolase [Bermanella marisrubri]EAT11129.1 beta-lactamase related protein [Oceanobacter sp. RED65] [Bermanella marisrubri]QIZ83454.1 MBL fold metallo-hydrolase [Bermanella marisrubri]